MKTELFFFFRLTLAVLSAAVLQGCNGKDLSLKIGATTSNTLSGSVLNFQALSAANVSAQSTCAGQTVQLYSLDAQGKKNVLLSQTAVDSSGKYNFTDLKSQGLSIPTKAFSETKYLLEFTCGTSTYQRFLSGIADQNLSDGSTLLTWINQTGLSSKVLTQPSSTWDNFYTSLADAGSASVAFSTLNGNAQLNQSFTQTFGSSPSILLDAVPQIGVSTVPGQFQEEASQGIAVQAFHWSPAYTIAYQWKMGSTVLSTSPNFTYMPTANSQGAQVLQLFMGQDDGVGNLNLAKPFTQKTFYLNISNNIPATVPGVSLLTSASTTSTAAQIRIATGSLVNGRPQNCKTFSKLALVEESSPALGLAPFLESAYTLDCTSAVTQDVNVTLSGTEGSRVLRLWAMDAAGNISLASSDVNVFYDGTAPVVSLTSLNSGESIPGGLPFNITWSASDNFPATNPIKLEYSSNNGSTWTTISAATANTGSFSWTVPSLNSALMKVRVTMTDSSGNSTAAVSASTFTVDSTAPTLSITAPATAGQVILTTALSSFTFSGACSENGRSVAISGAVTGSATCTSGSWSASLDLTSVADGTVTLTATHTDLAGNSVSASRTVVVDQTAPTLTLTSLNSGAAAGATATNITWTATDSNLTATPLSLFYSIDSGSTWTSIASSQANSGTYAWTVPSLNLTTARVKLVAIDKAGNSSAAISSSDFTIDSTKPVVATTTVSGSTSVTNNYIPMNLSATDNYNITHFCFTYNSTTPPPSSDSCWIPVSSAGATAGTSISFNNYYFRVGFGAGTYAIYGWTKDEAGNVSATTQTAGVDKATITYTPGSPPVMTSVLAVSNNASSTPPSSGDLTIASGASVYIYWKASDAAALPSTAISLSYTTNEVTTTAVPGATGLPNSAGAGCTLFGSYTGCFKWTNGSPLSTYYKIQASVTNADGYTALNVSPAINSTAIQFLAGNTSTGTGASATAGVFLSTPQGDPRQYNPGTVIVHPNGTIYFKDASRGVLKIDPSTGLTTSFLRTTGSFSGDGGPVTSATAAQPVLIALDKNNNLLVFDNNRIRLIDLSLATPTISTLIGGGASTADTVAVATSLQLISQSINNSYASGLYPLPNGDILFRSEPAQTTTVAPRIRWYHASDGSITTVYFSGTNIFPSPGQTIDVNTCRTFFQIAPVLDNSGTLISFFTSILAVPLGSASGCQYNAGYATVDVVFNLSGVVSTVLASSGGQTGITLGRNYSLYRTARYNIGLQKFDPSTLLWTNQSVAGGIACPDGASFSTCQTPYDDIFVDLNGKYYFADNGRIRTVTDAGNLLTLAGQSLNYGEGLNPLQARFGTIQSFGLWNDGSQDKVVTLDTQQHYLREFGLSASGTVNAIAGTGVSGTAASGSTALTTPIFDVTSVAPQNGMVVDALGNIYLSNAFYSIGLLTRSTGNWTTVAGGGATWYYSAAENTTGTSIRYGNANGMVQLLGSGNGQVVLSTETVSGSYRDRPAFKLIDQSTFKQTSLTSSSATNVLSSTAYGASGTSLSDVLVPLGQNNSLSVAYDNTNAWWYANSSNSADRTIYKLTPGGTLTSYASLTPQIVSMAYYRSSATIEYFYVCNGTQLYKILMTSGSLTSQTTLPWPVPGLTCTGKTLIYSPSRSSLIFAYKQNGLTGIAEYPNP